MHFWLPALISFFVFLEMLSQAALPVPLVTEFPIGDPVAAPRAGDQYNPSIAVSSNLFLVVWTSLNRYSTLPSQIYAARVNQAGEVIDPEGILLGSGKGKPAVAGNGQDFLVVWKMDDEYYLTGTTYFGGVRVALDGTISATYPSLATEAVRDGAPPALAAIGSDYLLAWTQQYYGPPPWPDGPPTPTVQRINARTLGASGPGPAFAVGDELGGQAQPVLATDGTQYLLAWQQRGGITATRLAADGTILQTPTEVSPPQALKTSPRAASAGGNFLIVWEDTRNGNYDLYGARLSAGGLLLDPESIPIITDVTGQGSPTLTSSGTNYLLAWTDYADVISSAILGILLSPDGTSQSGQIISICTEPAPQSLPSASWDGHSFFVVWEDRRTGWPNLVSYWNIYGTPISGSGVVQTPDGAVISMAPNTQSSPAIAFNGQLYLAVWSDNRNAAAGLDIYGARITHRGVLLDPGGIPICIAPGNQSAPAVSAAQGKFLVVWEDRRPSLTQENIYGTTVSASGAVASLTGTPICTVSNVQSSPSVASDGTNFLVAWEDWRPRFPLNQDIYASRVTHTGAVLDSNGFLVCSFEQPQRFPTVASCAGGYLVVWEDWRATSIQASTDIYGARITPAGTVLDPTGVPISVASGNQYRPRVAASTNSYFVVWHDFRSAPQDVYGNGPADVYATLVEPNGTVGFPSGLAISATTNAQYYPDVVAGTENFLVLWQDSRARGTNGWDLYGARVSPAGLILDPDSWPLAAGGASREVPRLGFGGDDTFVALSTALVNAHPTVLASFIALGGRPVLRSITPTSGGVLLSWLSAIGRTYAVQRSESLGSESWINLVGDVIATNTISSKFDDTTPRPPQRFYRVLQLPD